MFSQEPTLARVQREELKILMQVDRICRKNKITYILMSGTLLGAVRHQGFIPWDDDIDIAMPREDFERFARLAQQELPPNFVFQMKQNDPNYHLLFGKVRNRDTHIEDPVWGSTGGETGIYIDVFPLDRALRFPVLQKFSIQYIAALDFLLRSRYAVNVEKRSGFKRRMLLRLMGNVSTGTLHRMQDLCILLCSKFGSEKVLCSLGGVYGYPKEIYPASHLFPPTELEFEGTRFWAPRNWDVILKDLYGEYNELPPEGERKPKNDMNYVRFKD